MKKLFFLFLFLFPSLVFGQVLVPNGGTGKNSFSAGALLVGDTSLRLNSTTSPTVGWITATTSNATSTLQKTSISGAISLLGEYFTNFTTYVRSLFSATAPITYSAGGIGCVVADTSHAGCLSLADWNTFNGKQNSLGFTPAAASRLINTTYPLLGGGDLTADRTLSLAFGTTTQNNWSLLQDFQGNASTTQFGSDTTNWYFNNTGKFAFGTTSMVSMWSGKSLLVENGVANQMGEVAIVGDKARAGLTFFSGDTVGDSGIIQYWGGNGFSICNGGDYTTLSGCSTKIKMTTLGHLLVGSLTDSAFFFVQPEKTATHMFRVSSTTADVALDIDRFGNVGIASSTPNNKLDVNGNSYVSGTAFFGGAITATSTLDVSGNITTNSKHILYDLASSTATSALNSTSPKSVTASCPAGYNVLGGGGSTTPAQLIGIVGSQPDAGMNGWTETGAETPSTANNWQVSAYAICAKFNL